MNHRALLTLTLAALLLGGCRESFQDRCRREALDYNAHMCPDTTDCVWQGDQCYLTVTDSMVYTDDPSGFTYYQTIAGAWDSPSFFTPDLVEGLHDERLAALRNSIPLKPYKDHLLTFAYIYRSATTGETLLHFVFTPDDY